MPLAGDSRCPSILPTPAKLLKFGDRVRFAGARREQVKHLDARAGRLDAARDRPRDASSPRAEFRRGPMPCAPGTRRRLALPPCSVGA